MKSVKFLLAIFAMAMAMNVSAQSKTTAKSKTTTTTTTAKTKTATAAPAKKATAAKSTATTTATTTAKTTTTTTATTASKPAAATTKTAKASASKPAKKSSFLASNGFTPSNHFMLETKIGGLYGTGGFGENFVFEREFHKYIAWDIVSLDFNMPFNTNFLTMGVKTGIRGYTPRWWDGKMRGYSNLAVGYDCLIYLGNTRDILKWEGAPTELHGFGLSWGIGVEIVDHFLVGYGLEYNSGIKSTAHFAKLTYKF